MIGPRDSVMAILSGSPMPNPLTDMSEWVNSDCMTWPELHELWIDKIHDHVGEESDED